MKETPFQRYYVTYDLTHLQGIDQFIPAFASSDIIFYPYQVGAAMFATRSPYHKGAILMDESGLGKSTEAMLVIIQKWYAGQTKILIAVPSMDLLLQWQEMLAAKYTIPYVVISAQEQLEQAEGVFEQEALVLTTYDFAVQNTELVAKTNWDLAVFEEASLLCSVHKEENKEAKVLKQITEGAFKLLLTGTPIEKNILDLYGLMYFIDETLLPDEREYMARYFRKPENYPELGEVVSKYCFRTLRSQAKQYAKIPERMAVTWEFEQSDEEQQLYDALQSYIDQPVKYVFPEMNPYDLALMLFDLQGSSTAAILKALEGIAKRLENVPGAEAERQNFLEMCELARGIKIDRKTELLLSALEKGFAALEKTGANRKAVIFTSSRATQQYLYDLLKEKYRTYLYNGSKNYQDIQRFKAEGEILIATDHGARGFNLEEACFVVNYDLLYNTLKMEQRIDRCHRLNQKNDVLVLNFLNKTNMADVRKLELVNKRMLVAGGVVGLSDDILGGFAEDGVAAIDALPLRTQEQIEKDYAAVLERFAEENKRDVAAAEQALFTSFTREVARQITVSPQYANEKIRKVNDALWGVIKGFFEDYNESHTDCHFAIDEDKRTVTAEDYEELPTLFYYWSNGRSKRYQSLKKFKNISLLSPLAKGILANTECSNYGIIWVNEKMEKSSIGFYTVDIYAGDKPTGKTYLVLVGKTAGGEILTEEECKRILALPSSRYEEEGDRQVSWLKGNGRPAPHPLDELVAAEDYVQRSLKEYTSIQGDEIDRIKRQANIQKNELRRQVEHLKTAVQRLEEKVEQSTGSRLERLRLEKQLGETKRQLLRQEETIFFDGMKIDQAAEGEIEAFLAKERMSAKWTRHFVVDVVGSD